MISKRTRREFLRQSMIGATALSTLTPKLLLAEQAQDVADESPTLVCVYLRGGADALNTFIPYGDPTYYNVRPTIAVPHEPSEGGEEPLIKLDNFWGMHPAMAPLVPIFEAGHIAPILSAGSPHDTRSHFDAQDFMERAAPGIKSVTEGWLNRYLSMTRKSEDSDLRAIGMDAILPRSLRGQYPVLAIPTISDQSVNSFRELYRGCDDCKETDKTRKAAEAAQAAQTPAARAAAARQRNQPQPPVDGSVESLRSIRDAGTNTIRRLDVYRKIVQAPTPAAANYPNSNFGRKMADIAKLVRAKQQLEVACIDYRGWDHHAFQGASEGIFGRMMGDLSQSLRAFYDDMGAARMRKTLVLLMTEFGRNVRENGNNGTDHGRGGFMLAMGGMLNGKRFYGRWTGLDPNRLADRRDLPVHVDFRQVFAESLHCLFNFDHTRHQFFPGYNNRQYLSFMNPIKRA